MAARWTAGAQSADEPVPIRRSSGDLLEPFDRVYDRIAKGAFEPSQENSRRLRRDSEDHLDARPEAPRVLQPGVAVQESEGGFTVRVRVAGFLGADLQIELEPRRLRVAGARPPRTTRKRDRARRADRILRVVDFPVEVDLAKASASVKRGRLIVFLRKAVPARFPPAESGRGAALRSYAFPG